MKTDTVKAVLLVAGVGLVAWKVIQAKKAATELVTKTINPASNENLFFELSKGGDDKDLGAEFSNTRAGRFIFGLFN